MEKNSFTKIIIYWLPVLAWMSVIFFLSSRPSVTVSGEYWYNFLFFKSLHVVEYAFLFVLCARALKGTVGKKTNIFLVAFVIAVLYGLSDEIHQTFVYSREGRMRDVIIDGIGASIAWLYLQKLLPKAPMPLKNLAKQLGVL